MKNAKVTALVFDKEWGDGPMYQYRIEFDNGDKGKVSFKTKDPWCKAGDAVDYEGPDGPYEKIKLTRPQGGGGFGGGGGGRPAMAPRNDRAIIAQSSMDRAVQLVCHDKIPLDKVREYAEKIMTWVCEKGGVK